MGISCVAIAGNMKNADSFVNEVWKHPQTNQPLPFYHDPQLDFFKAVQGGKLKKANNANILRPSVLIGAVGDAKKVGNKQDDIGKEGTIFLGGEMVVNSQEVEFFFPETSKFQHADVDKILAQCQARAQR